MKKLLIICFVLIAVKGICQDSDSLLTYSKVLHADSLTKDQIFDRTLVWCAQAFNNSNFAIKIQEKESGLIGGKASFENIYHYPKPNSISVSFYHFKFDWLIEIKDGKVRFSLKNILVSDYNNRDYVATSQDVSPITFMFASKRKINDEWHVARESFIKNIDALLDTLEEDLNKPKTDF